MPNGIELLLADHQRVTDLFGRFAETEDASYVGRIIDVLAAHDDAEQGGLYPLVGNLLGDVDMVERAATAHSLVKQQIDIVSSLEGPALVSAVAVLQELVAKHVEDEEANILPALAEVATAQQLQGLAARIMQIKQRVG